MCGLYMYSEILVRTIMCIYGGAVCSGGSDPVACAVCMTLYFYSRLFSFSEICSLFLIFFFGWCRCAGGTGYGGSHTFLL